MTGLDHPFFLKATALLIWVGEWPLRLYFRWVSFSGGAMMEFGKPSDPFLNFLYGIKLYLFYVKINIYFYYNILNK